ncbi:MAG: winged helix-turn-helix domain-containing protein [Sulfurovum sp.]|jgi:DNA-binding response OmpR family regulator|nr:MAG: Uncharacterised protein [Arcobacter lacus]
MKNIDLEFAEEEISKINQAANNSDQDILNYLKELILNEVDSVYFLENNYTYDKKKRVLIDDEKKPIKLTELERMLVEHLLSKPNQYVNVEEIFQHVKKSKEMSVFSLRNKIKSIRDKTFKDIITSKINIGYKINVID